MAGTESQGQPVHTMSQQRPLCFPQISTCLLQAAASTRAQTPYLIKGQYTEEVLGVLLGNPDSFLFGHAAVTRQAVTQKYPGISQLVESPFLRKKGCLGLIPQQGLSAYQVLCGEH